MKQKKTWVCALLLGALAGGLQAAHPSVRKIGEMPVRTGSPKIPVVLVQFKDKAMSEADPNAGYTARLSKPATMEEVDSLSIFQGSEPWQVYAGICRNRPCHVGREGCLLWCRWKNGEG